MREKKKDVTGLVLVLVLAAEAAAASSASDRHRFYGDGVSLTVSMYSRIYELPRFALVVFFYLPATKEGGCFSNLSNFLNP